MVLLPRFQFLLYLEYEMPKTKDEHEGPRMKTYDGFWIYSLKTTLKTDDLALDQLLEQVEKLYSNISQNVITMLLHYKY